MASGLTGVRVGLALLVGVVESGCATTMSARFGPLADGRSLVTLVVSEDLEVVRRECASVPARARILGCQLSTPSATPSALPVRTIKIVRYAETLPSAVTFEIDAHELCHAIASLQLMPDPCHEGNGGVLQALRSSARVR